MDSEGCLYPSSRDNLSTDLGCVLCISSSANFLHVHSTKHVWCVTPATILINGLGRYPGGPDVPLSVITVEQGKRYRFRLINMACRLHILFSITNHNLIIIEADGQTMLLLVVNEIPIYPGQQYLFILEANQPVNH